MTVFVTGAGGFIGSHVVEALLAEGHHVRALVRYNSRGEWGNLESVRGIDHLDVVLGDVTDGRQMRTAIEGCETVLHLAALIGIPYSYESPASYLATNVMGTLSVLEACRDCGVERVVVTSTSEVYGTARYTPITEEHPLQAQSPYAATKIAADKLTESYARSFGMPTVVLRPFNTYGPRQSSRAIIPTVLSQALGDAEEIRLGNLSPKRDLTYVSDTARAFVLAATTPRIEGETIHVGSGQAISVGDLARLALEVVGSSARIVTDDARIRPPASEVELLLCDASVANERLGWQPEVGLREGLRRAADYMAQHRRPSPTLYMR